MPRVSTVRLAPLLAVLLLIVSACSPSGTTSSQPSRRRAPRAAPRETVTVRDPELERRIGRLELRLMEKEAQVEDLQSQLEATRNEVVRTMAKLQTVASRAEAASGMAEAEVALQSLRADGSPAPEIPPISRLIEQASAEFNKQNYGGALYLAVQAKSLATASRGRLAVASRAVTRAGETPFAIPLALRATGRGNVREGPGTGFAVAFAVEAGAALTGFSYVDEWVRVTDESGRSGWIFRSLIARR